MKPQKLLLMMTLLCAVRADAQQLSPDTPVIRLKPLLVQATTPFTTSGGASALAVRVDSMRLAPNASVEQVMRQLPFVQVRTNARGEAYFALRGSTADAREVAVMLDGVPMSLGFDHRADLSVIPVSGARTLTFVRGIPSLLYGPNVLGGVIDVGLAQRDETRSAVFKTGLDDTGAKATSGSVTLPQPIGRGTLLFRAGGGYRGADGFPLPGDVKEPAPYTTRDLRLNSDRVERNGFATVRYDASGGAWLSAAGSGYSGTRGTPAELNTNAPHYWRYPSLRRSIGIFSAGSGQRASPMGGHASLQASVGYDAGHIALDDYHDRTYTNVVDTERDHDRNITTRLLGVQSIGSRGDFSVAGTFADVRRTEVLTPGATSLYRQRLWSGAAETGWRIAGARVVGGVAYDVGDTPASADKNPIAQMHEWGGRVGVTRAVGNNIVLHAGMGRRARFPALREMYSGPLKSFEPNPDLQPEKLTASEAGFTFQTSRAQLQTVVFHHRIDDEIVRSVTAAKKVKRINRDRTTSSGVELLASTTLREILLAADVTAQTVMGTNPVNDTDFRDEYQPKWAGGAHITAPLPFGLRGQAGARVTGAQYCLSTSGVYSKLEKTTRADAELWKSWHGVELSVAGDNLTDVAIYDQCGLPQPGRLFRFGLTLR